MNKSIAMFIHKFYSLFHPFRNRQQQYDNNIYTHLENNIDGPFVPKYALKL